MFNVAVGARQIDARSCKFFSLAFACIAGGASMLTGCGHGSSSALLPAATAGTGGTGQRRSSAPSVRVGFDASRHSCRRRGRRLVRQRRVRTRRHGTLAANGIYVDVIASASQSDFQTWMNCVGSAAELIEGLNERDLSNDSNWVADLQANQQGLAQQYTSIPHVSPALTSEAAYTAVGSLANFVSFGNAHVYFAGRNPGTSGWGASDQFGTYGSLSWNLGMSAQVSGSHPMLVTESGYSDQSDQYALPAVTKARYMTRLLLDNWNGGAARTYIYELIDESGPPFSHYGITDASGNPKSAYTAVANLLGHLNDPGGTFSPAALSYNFIASTSVAHTLLEKRNGTYELVFWNEASRRERNNEFRRT